jgi:restriction endonuclease S subunit
MSELHQPVWFREEEAPPLPDGWCYLPTEEACVQLKPGKLFENKTVAPEGAVPVINQSQDGIIGYHDEEPGVVASRANPVVTFANHTCAMRLMTEPFSCIQNIFPKVGKEGVADTKYFYYASQGRVGISDYKGHHPVFRKTLIPIPPLPTQRRIAGILSAYDDLIGNNLRRIKILEEMAQSLYREWFVHFRFPGYESVRFVDSEIGRIPKGWDVKVMTEAVTVRPKVSIPRGGDIPFVTMGGLSENSMLITEVESRSAPTGARFQNGDTLFARITPCLENGKTGYVEFLPSDESAACGSTEFIVLRSRTVCPEYVYLMARSAPFRDNAIKSMSGATGRQRVQEECFEQFFLAQPPAELLGRFQAFTRPQFQAVHSLYRRNQTLRETRNLLLPDLLSENGPRDCSCSL